MESSKERRMGQVRAEAKSCDEKMHIGRIFDVVVQKNYETDHPKWKDRVVFGGGQVKDE